MNDGENSAPNKQRIQHTPRVTPKRESPYTLPTSSQVPSSSGVYGTPPPTASRQSRVEPPPKPPSPQIAPARIIRPPDPSAPVLRRGSRRSRSSRQRKPNLWFLAIVIALTAIAVGLVFILLLREREPPAPKVASATSPAASGRAGPQPSPARPVANARPAPAGPVANPPPPAGAAANEPAAARPGRPAERIPPGELWAARLAAASNNGPAAVEATLAEAARETTEIATFWLWLANTTERHLRDAGKLSRDDRIARVTPLYEKALRLGGTDPVILGAVTDFLLASGRIEDALAVTRTLTALLPFNPKIQQKRASLLAGTGHANEALALLADLAGRFPANSEIRTDYVRQLLSAGDFNRALREADGCLIIEPDSVELASIKASILLNHEKRPAEAIDFLSGFLRKMPDNVQLNLLLAQAFAAQNNWTEARAALLVIADAAANAPARVAATYHTLLGLVAHSTGDVDTAIASYQKAIDLAPDAAPDACNNLAYLWIEKKSNLEAAIACARKAVAQAPGNPAYLDTLGWGLLVAGNAAEAATTLELAIAKSKPQPEQIVLVHLGDAYAALGRAADARKAWERGLALAPDNADLKARLEAIPGTQAN